MDAIVKYSLKTRMFLWLFQIGVSIILISSAWQKLINPTDAVALFETINMGSGGRIFTGVLELAASLLLLSNRFSASGALLGTGLMTGALLIHFSVIGISSALPAAIVLTLCVIILVIRKKEIPLIGDQL